MTSVVVVQARSSSSRLPAKVFLPVGGISIAVLAAQRAANTGRSVIVATSDDETDDAFAAMLMSKKLNCYRGSLDNTLGRFVGALADYDDDTVVIRLTADNVCPDGTLIDEMEKHFLSERLHYLCSTGQDSGLPYGMSVEIMWLRDLREAHDNTRESSDSEHVTPYIIRKHGTTVFRNYEALSASDYRCTVDNLDDYLLIRRVFDDVDDPIHEPFLSLVDRVVRLGATPSSAPKPIPLIIGGAQIGLDYGISNRSGRPSPADAQRLLKAGLENGISIVDTASAYGCSEESIGKALSRRWGSNLSVITKIDDLSTCPADASPAVVSAFVDASVYRSCTRLRREQLDVVLLHRVAALESWNGAAWERLLDLAQRGLISRLGASVQTPAELLRVLQEPQVSVIQMPFNILDTRWTSAIDALLEAKRQRRIDVHVRSVFLQGLLLTDDLSLWDRANCQNSREIIDWLHQQARLSARESVADLCLAYVRGQKWADGIVIGMEDVSQLVENVRLTNTPLLTETEMANIGDDRPSVGESTLNPARWRAE